jgi:hypothetical protein
MMKIVLIVALMTLPIIAEAIALEHEAATVCNSVARIKKECYLKAQAGMSPMQTISNVDGGKLPKQIIEYACQSGYDTYSQAGDVGSAELDRSLQVEYVKCVPAYVERGYCAELMSWIKNSKIFMEASYLDNHKYPKVVPFEASPPPKYISIKVSNVPANSQAYTLKVISDKCSKAYQTSNEEASVVEVSK